MSQRCQVMSLPTTQSDLVGSSQEEIVSCLGVPDNQIELNGEDIWEYQFTSVGSDLQCKTTFRFANSKVKAISFTDFDNSEISEKYSRHVCFPIVERCGKHGEKQSYEKK
jgi:hypothetical protein